MIEFLQTMVANANEQMSKVEDLKGCQLSVFSQVDKKKFAEGTQVMQNFAVVQISMTNPETGENKVLLHEEHPYNISEQQADFMLSYITQKIISDLIAYSLSHGIRILRKMDVVNAGK
jgi:hypothetical protein